MQKNGDLTECLAAFEIAMVELEKDLALKRKQEREKRRRVDRKNREAFLVCPSKRTVFDEFY